MDKLSKRVMYNPDGSFVMKTWNDSVVVKGKQETVFGPKNSSWSTSENNPIDIQLMDELEERYLDEIGYSWETEIDYY